MDAPTLPALISHRGNAEEFPENTIESMRSAIGCGARNVEFDVQMTRDRMPVVLHDGDLTRTTDRDAVVMDLRLDELEAVDAGEPRRFGTRFAGVRIPSLSEMVEMLAGHPGITAFVEIKAESLERFGIGSVVPRVLEVLEPLADRSVILSFAADALEVPKGRFPVGWVLPRWGRGARSRAEALRPDYLVVNHRKIFPGRGLWPGTWRWVLYEVREPARAPEFARRGADFIETMAIARFARHPLYREALLGPV